MKKELLFLVFMLFFSVSYSQKPLCYSNVEKVENTSANELFTRASIWLAETYVNPKEVVQYSDKESHIIISKGAFLYQQSFPSYYIYSYGYVKYTMKFEFKEGKYKYTITDFIHDENSGKGYSFGLITDANLCPNPKLWQKKWSNLVWKDIKTSIETKVRYGLILDFKKAMLNNSVGEEW